MINYAEKVVANAFAKASDIQGKRARRLAFLELNQRLNGIVERHNQRFSTLREAYVRGRPNPFSDDINSAMDKFEESPTYKRYSRYQINVAGVVRSLRWSASLAESMSCKP